MRFRLGLLVAALFAALLSPIAPPAQAFSGYASAPLSVSATAINGGVRVGWSTPSDVDTGITGYRIEYSTSGTSGTWLLANTVAANIYTYDITGLSLVPTYTRVAATTSAGTGTYGYPWTKIYGTTSLNRDSNGYIVYESGYGLGGSDPYTTLNSASFTRIRWRMDTTISGVTKYAEADSYKWVTGSSTNSRYNTDSSVTSLMLPGTVYPFSIQANVTDLNVYSDHTNVTKGKGLNGRLEMWPYNYDPGTSGLTGTGSPTTYDYDDNSAGSAAYGSYQVIDMTNLKQVFSWNNINSGAVAEVGYGNAASGNPDWTFCSGAGTCPTPSAFKIQVFINMPVTPYDGTAPTVTRIDAKTLAKNTDTITVRSNELGTVYLVRNSVTVTNSASLSSAASNVRNSVSITSANTNTTLTTSGLSDGTYNLYAVDAAGNLSAGILSTIVMDSTAPTISAYSVNAAGTAIILTVSETSTLPSFASGAYSVSDSGSAISVSSASISGLTLTLNLSRSIPANAYVTFAYTPSSVSANERWIDSAGNALAAIALRNITNNSSAPITVTLSVPSPITKGVSITVTASVSVAGKVTFFLAGKRIPGCLNKTAAGTTPISVTCTFKPALSSAQTIKAVLVPTIGAYSSASAQTTPYILKRSNTR